VGETPAQVGVVCTGDFEELDAPDLQVCDGGDDVVGAEGDVLDTGAVVVVDESGFWSEFFNSRAQRTLRGLGIEGYDKEGGGGGVIKRTPQFGTSFYPQLVRSWAF
jgi:hypothetical protein